MARILVVDDEADVRELLTEYLRTLGHDVVGLRDGASAIAYLDTTRVDLVFSDLQMPKQDGLAVLRYVHLYCPDVAFVIITGYASLDSAIQAVRLGAADYLTKPFSLRQIDQCLAKILTKAKVSDEPAGTVSSAPALDSGQSSSADRSSTAFKILFARRPDPAFARFRRFLARRDCEISIVSRPVDVVEHAIAVQPDMMALDPTLEEFDSINLRDLLTLNVPCVIVTRTRDVESVLMAAAGAGSHRACGFRRSRPAGRRNRGGSRAT